VLAAALVALGATAAGARSAPPAPRVAGPTATTDTTPTFTFRAAGARRFLCSVDAARPRACRSPWTPRLALGAHTLRVRGVDARGRRGPARVLRVRISPPPSPLRVSAPVAVDGLPFGLTLAGDSLWVASFTTGAVQRLDPTTGARRASVFVGEPATSVVGTPDGAVWAASFGRSEVVRVDGDTAGARLAVGPGPEGLVWAASALWTANKGCLDPSRPCPGPGSATRVDPATGARLDIPLGLEPRYVSAGAAAVWATSFGSDSLSRIDPLTGAVTTTAAPSGPNGVVEAFGSVWVAGWNGGEVWRYDPASLAVTARLRLPLGSGPEGLGVGDAEIWVANDVAGTVSRIDPTTNRVTATVRAGSGPRQIAAGPGFAWVTLINDAAVRRVERR
jgi:YVTN family beta-propeller protein